MKILIAHPDDESVGAYNMIRIRNIDEVILINPFEQFPDVRIEEISEMCKKNNITFTQVQTVNFEKGEGYLFPTPNSHHPHHKYVAMKYLEALKEGADVYFYDVEMIEPWTLRLPLKLSEEKRKFLNKYYPSQKSLWESDYKYWLFEGVIHLLVPP